MAFNGSPDEQFSSSRPLFTRDTSGHGVLVEINFLEGSGAWREGEIEGNFRNEARGRGTNDTRIKGKLRNEAELRRGREKEEG